MSARIEVLRKTNISKFEKLVDIHIVSFTRIDGHWGYCNYFPCFFLLMLDSVWASIL